VEHFLFSGRDGVSKSMYCVKTNFTSQQVSVDYTGTCFYRWGALPASYFYKVLSYLFWKKWTPSLHDIFWYYLRLKYTMPYSIAPKYIYLHQYPQIFFILCALCCQFLWIVHCWWSLRYSLTLIVIYGTKRCKQY
jgi:hypothetical protein